MLISPDALARSSRATVGETASPSRWRRELRIRCNQPQMFRIHARTRKSTNLGREFGESSCALEALGPSGVEIRNPQTQNLSHKACATSSFVLEAPSCLRSLPFLGFPALDYQALEGWRPCKASKAYFESLKGLDFFFNRAPDSQIE